MSPRRGAALACLLAALTAPRPARPQGPPPELPGCEIAIDPQVARTLYQSINTPTPDGCRLETLATQRFTAQVRLRHGAEALAPLVLASSRCLAAATVRGANLAIEVPQSTRDACPLAVARAVRTVTDFDFAAAAPGGFGTRGEARRSTAALLVTLLAALGACGRLLARTPSLRDG